MLASAAGVKQRWGYGSVLRHLALLHAEAPLPELLFTRVGKQEAVELAPVHLCVRACSRRRKTHIFRLAGSSGVLPGN